MTEHAWNMRRANMRQNGFGTEVMKGIKVCSACGTVMPVTRRTTSASRQVAPVLYTKREPGSYVSGEVKKVLTLSSLLSICW